MIYLDNSATTRPKEEVLNYIWKMMKLNFGNPSSLHQLGLQAEKEMQWARKQVAKALHVEENQIFFCGSGTLANNICLQGILQKSEKRGRKEWITTSVEHPSVDAIAEQYKNRGFVVNRIAPTKEGDNVESEILRLLTKETACVSIMHVNNEIGTIFDVEKISLAIKAQNPDVHVHVDGVQAFGKLKMDLKNTGIDSYSLSGHKVNALKGIGAYYLKNQTAISPILFGSGQERGLVPGTENIPGILSLGKATELFLREDEMESVSKVKAYLRSQIIEQIEDVRINTPENSAPHLLNISFLGVRAEVLLHYLEKNDIFVSTGSACSSKKKKQSKILLGYGFSEEVVDSALRFSLDYQNTKEEMDKVINVLKDSVQEIRKIMKR